MGDVPIWDVAAHAAFAPSRSIGVGRSYMGRCCFRGLCLTPCDSPARQIDGLHARSAGFLSLAPNFARTHCLTQRRNDRIKK